MKAWAQFLYGVSVGMAIAWGLAVLLLDGGVDARWFAVGAATALAVGLKRASTVEPDREGPTLA